MEPLGKMNAIFPVVNEHINKRAHKVCNLVLLCSLRPDVSMFRSSWTMTPQEAR